MTVERITSSHEGGAYSAAVIAPAGRLAFVSGHTAESEGTLEEQTEITLTKLLRTIEAAGGRKQDIIRCTCYLADISGFHQFDAVYRTFFEGALPARTTVQAQLADNAKVEIEAIVSLDRQEFIAS
jgi:enamine deaminase RidA (YjgF/YER057c/UK114 family)